METDLSETRNLADANRKIVERVTTLLRRYIARDCSMIGVTQETEAEASLEMYSVRKKKANKVQYRTVLDDVERHKGNRV